MSKPQLSADTWVIIPAYNEEKYIQKVLAKIKPYTENIIVVDDGSVDQTQSLASQSVKYALRHPINLGKGAALKTGCDFAFQELNARAVILLDGDDQHDPAELPLFDQALKKHDMVFGIREVKQKMPWLRSQGNQLASLLVKAFFGTYIPDIPSGYKAFTREVYQHIRWGVHGYAVELEIAARVARYKVPFTTICIATIYHDMNRGMTFLDTLNVFWYLFNWKMTL